MMKTNLIYALMVCSALFWASACTSDYEDATSLHVYGPNENPPVKTGPEGTVTNVFEMQGGNLATVSVNIDQYEDVIQKQLGMNISELLANIEKGTVVVCPINSARNVWNKAKANVEGRKYGWYVNKTGNVCETDDEGLYGSIEFDAATHEFIFQADQNAGGAASIEIGFALDGPNYNTAVRFVLSMTVYDRSFIFMDLTIPTGDYEAALIDPNDIADNISYVFGMSPSEFVTAMMDGTLGVYIIDRETNAYQWDGESTANGGGYWCNLNNEICTWGEEGFAYYIEPWLEDTPPVFALGRAPGIASGTVYVVKFGVANSDHTKALSFFITATFA